MGSVRIIRVVAVVLLMPRGILGVLQQKYNLPRTI